MTSPRSKIFFINLDRSESRRAKMREQLDSLGLSYERFPAVDGKAAPDEFLSRYYSEELNKKKYYVPLVKSEIACYISHLKICEKILLENLDYAVVLEDDIILKDSFKFIQPILDSIKNWNYIKLAETFKKQKVASREPIAFEAPAAKTAFELVRWKKPPIGMQAYAVSKEAARELLEKRSVFFRPIDVDLQFTWETNLDIQGILPTFCELADSSAESTIPRKKNYHYPLARLIFKIKYAIASLLAK